MGFEHTSVPRPGSPASGPAISGRIHGYANVPVDVEPASWASGELGPIVAATRERGRQEQAALQRRVGREARRKLGRAARLDDRVAATRLDRCESVVIHRRSFVDGVRLESRAWTVLVLGCLGFTAAALLAEPALAWGAPVLIFVAGIPLWGVLFERRSELLLREDGLFAARRGRRTFAGSRQELELVVYDTQHRYIELRDVEIRCNRSADMIRCEGLKPADAARLRAILRSWAHASSTSGCGPAERAPGPCPPSSRVVDPHVVPIRQPVRPDHPRHVVHRLDVAC